jgi:hypothetical protein
MAKFKVKFSTKACIEQEVEADSAEQTREKVGERWHLDYSWRRAAREYEGFGGVEVEMGMSKRETDGAEQSANAMRAQRAEALLQRYRELYMDPDDTIRDVMPWVLADCMHWSDSNEVEFDDQIARAMDHYGDEKAES